MEILTCLGAIEPGKIGVGRWKLTGGEVDKAKFRRQVSPGETLDLHVDMTRLSARGGKGSPRAEIDGQVAFQCESIFVLVPGDEALPS